MPTSSLYRSHGPQQGRRSFGRLLRPQSRVLAALTAIGAVLAVVAGLSPAVAGAAGDFSLSYSLPPQRTDPAPLAGAVVEGSVYIFTVPSTGVREVRFWLDDPDRTGAPRMVEKGAPHDFAGSAKDGSALPFDTKVLAAGAHTVTAEIVPTSGANVVLSAAFSKGAPLPSLTVSPASIALTSEQGGPGQRSTLSVSGPTVDFTATSSADWISVTPSSATAPATVTVTVDPSTLPVGSATGSVTLSAPSRQPIVVPVSVTVTAVTGSGNSSSGIVFSKAAKRTSPVALNGTTVAGNIYPFLTPDAGVTSVSWYLDDPTGSGTPVRVDTTSPFDY